MDAVTRLYSSIVGLTTLQVFALGYAAIVTYYFSFRLRSLKRFILDRLKDHRHLKMIQSNPVKSYRYTQLILH